MVQLPANRSHVPKMEQQLKSVAQALYSNVFNRPNGRDQQRYHLVAQIVESVLPVTWQNNPNSATIELFRRAVNRLPDDECPKHMAVNWLYIGEALYGFRDDLPEREDGGDHNYDTRYAYIKSLYDAATHQRRSKSTYERDVPDILGATMAAIFEQLKREGPKEAASDDGDDVQAVPELSQSESTTRDPNYVPRLGLHQRFDTIANQSDTRLIAITGFPGMGKTWFARAVARLGDGSEAPVIRVESGEIEEPDLQDACQRFGVKPESAISSDLRAYLTLLLCGEHAPKFVILDNLDSTDELVRLLPPGHTRSIVVATARKRGALLRAGWRFIDVGKMDVDEAIDLVHRHASQLSPEDTRMLASSLAGHPLAITYACRLVVKQDCPVSDFCDDLKVDARSVAERLPTEEGITLLVILRRLITFLEDCEPLAFRLLEVVAVFDHTTDHDPRCLRRYLEGDSGATLSVTTYRQTVDVLCGLRVMDFSSELLEFDDLGNLKRASLDIHPFARQVLRQEFRPRLAYICAQYLRSCKESGYNLKSVIILNVDLCAHAIIESGAEFEKVSVAFKEEVENEVASSITLWARIGVKPEDDRWLEWAKNRDGD